jgi:hypothetical protein
VAIPGRTAYPAPAGDVEGLFPVVFDHEPSRSSRTPAVSRVTLTFALGLQPDPWVAARIPHRRVTLKRSVPALGVRHRGSHPAHGLR